MKFLTLIVILYFALPLYGQNILTKNEVIARISNTEFRDYVQEFNSISLPISIPESYKEMYANISKGISYEIKPKYTKSFIMNNPQIKYNSDRFYFTHVYFLGGNSKYFMLVYTKTDNKPSISEGLSLFESFLATYDYSGRIISQIIISQESEKRYMESKITNSNEIETRSVCILNKGLNWPKLVDADYSKNEYKIQDNGRIVKKQSFSKKLNKVDREIVLPKLILMADK